MDRFLIAPFNSGLQQDLKSWMLPEDAFRVLNNAYVWRGRVRKRFGSRFMGQGWTSDLTEQLYSRLRVSLGYTALGAFAGTVPGSIFKLGQQFSVGDTILTVISDAAGPQAMMTTGTITGTYNVTNGNVTIAGAVGAVQVWFYPCEPVMGLTTYSDNQLITKVNDQVSFAFDTQFSYIFSSVLGEYFWQETSGTPSTVRWHGDDSDFFWTCTWQGLSGSTAVMFASNFQVANPNGAPNANDDPIWYLNDLTWTAASGANAFYTGPGGGAPQTGWHVVTARIIVPFKNRLLLLNTIENQGTSFGTTDGAGNFSGFAYGFQIGQVFTIGTTTFTVATAGNAANPLTVGGAMVGTGTYNTVTGALTFTAAAISTAITANGQNINYVGRVRYCHYGSPLSSNAWYEANQTDSAGGVGDGGGYNDASTEEQIVSVEFIKDRLIVFFERSTWELAYTGNAVQPFQWQKINTELGSESTFSSVPFDTQILTVGNTGVHACTGPNVQRIDVKIPDQVFKIANKEQGVARVQGIRDYYPEMVYWTFPSDNNADQYPNRILCYNYRNGSWSFNNDSITAFGYFNQQVAMTWENQTQSWQDSNFSWDSGTIQGQFRQVIAGNQQGFVFIISSEENRNERALSVTNVTQVTPQLVELVIINHNLQKGEYISLENMTGLSMPDSPIFQVVKVIDEDTIRINTMEITGTYLGGGNAARVSNINIVSKQWNPYVTKDRNVNLTKIDFCVLKTENGEITVDFSPSSADISMIDEGGISGTKSLMGTSVLETRPYQYATSNLEQFQENLWHPVYFQIDGTCVQIEMYFNDEQIRDKDIAWSPFEMSGLCLYTQPTSARMQ